MEDSLKNKSHQSGLLFWDVKESKMRNSCLVKYNHELFLSSSTEATTIIRVLLHCRLHEVRTWSLSSTFSPSRVRNWGAKYVVKESSTTMMVPCVSKFYCSIIYGLHRRHKSGQPVRMEAITMATKRESRSLSREENC